MLAYLTSVYLNIYSYGLWIFLALLVISVVGGIVLLFVMADNGEKGTLDFSLEHMAEKAKLYSGLISYWKKAAVLFVMVSMLAVFAPNEQIVRSWTAPPSPCAVVK